MTRLPLKFAGVALAAGLAAPLFAHEFWISPLQTAIAQGETIQAALKVGEELEGSEFPFLDFRFASFEMFGPNGAEAVTGTLGQSPALQYRPTGDGLYLAQYQSNPSTLHYKSWDTFTGFLAYEGLSEFAEIHVARGLPKTGFKELYTRHARALFLVGDGDAELPKPTGMTFEFLPLSSPFGADKITLQLLRDGMPVPDYHVNIFQRDAEIVTQTLRTDTDGKVTVGLAASGEFLASAVDIRESKESGIAWDSHWAALSFRR